MPSDRRFLCRYIVQEKNPASPSPGGRVANLTPLSLTKKRHVDSRIFGPQAQALPSDSAPPLPSSIRVRDNFKWVLRKDCRCKKDLPLTPSRVFTRWLPAARPGGNGDLE